MPGIGKELIIQRIALESGTEISFASCQKEFVG
jgi:hypothetical protein